MSVDVLENVGVEELSKNQLKKRKRYALYLEKKALRTQLRREKKRARRKTAHSDAAVKDSDKCLTISTETSSKSDCAVKDPIKCLTILPEASSSSDCAACPALPRVSRAVRHREEFLKKCALNPTVVVDCGFDEVQTEELNSLAQQLMLTYGLNRRSCRPFRLAFVGLYEKLNAVMNRVSGTAQWACELCNDALPIRFALNEATSEKLKTFVYLTADSDNVLDTLDAQCVYIIGGLVDRNRFKGLTRRRAEEWGISTARLPIEDHIRLAGCKVLTVNQVFCIMEKFMQFRDWKLAVEQGTPQRKVQQSQRTKTSLNESEAPDDQLDSHSQALRKEEGSSHSVSTSFYEQQIKSQ